MTASRDPLDYAETLLEALDNAGIALVITLDRGAAGLERLYFNRALCTLMGRTPEEVARASVLEAVVPEDRPRLMEVRQRLLAGGAAPMFLETVMVRPDGRRVPVEFGSALKHLPEGYVSLTFLRDVSERRALQAQQLEADRLSTVGALCAGLAHEINNPLTYVLLHLGGLRRSLDRWIPEPAARAHVAGVLDTIIEGSERVSAAVRALLVFADPAPQRRGSVRLREVVEGALRMSVPMVEPRAHVVAELDDVPPLDGDAARLGQAVLNIILDAALAFDSDDRERNAIHVRLFGDDTHAIVEVADNGRAVDRAATAFEPFFPARGATSTGLGLAVTRAITAAVGGSVTVAPRAPDAGGGVVVTMRLPRR